MLPRTLHIICAGSALLGSLIVTWPVAVSARQTPPPVPDVISSHLSLGEPQDLIVLFDDADVEAEVATFRQLTKIVYDDDSLRAVRRKAYRSIKQSVTAPFPAGDVKEMRDYDHLPMSLIRVQTRDALDRFLADPRVKAIYEDLPVYPHLAYSLPLIGQPAVAGAGMTGGGTTVAVIDTGIDYRHSAFGSCTAPGVPAGCRVVAAVDANGANNLVTTANNHGTNVSGIVAGVAPGTHIASFNALPGGSGSTSAVIAGINWAISNNNAYNITVINMSLGDSSINTAPCSDQLTNPYYAPVSNAWNNYKVITVASSGNDGYTNAISNPACTPGVVSVGAVYDAGWGGPFSWGSPVTCTDAAASAVNKIPCFSNTASFLTILAPGAFITAAGIQMAGTSQAAPHVAGAVAVLRAAYPSETLDQTVTRLTSSGVSITDTRNGINLIKPRLNLSAAITPPANNMLANRVPLGGDSGQVTGNNLNATKETGEPSHANNAGGKSVWWSWTPSVSGRASFDTHGSSFNTLLGVYKGTSVNSLLWVVSNDNDGSSGNTSGVSFNALAGTEYLIAVDGFGGVQGGIILNWSLAQQADLGIVMSQTPDAPFEGDTLTYTLTVTNYGPSIAHSVVVTDTLPAGLSFISATPGCAYTSGIVTCDLGTMTSNTSVTIQIVSSTLIALNLTNLAQVSTTTSDPQAANNSTSSTVTVSLPTSVPVFSMFGLIGTAVCLTGMAGASKPRRRKQSDTAGCNPTE